MTLRVTVAEDGALFRKGLVRLLEEAGHTVIAAVGDADALLAAVDADPPDTAVVDVRMPPDRTDDSMRAALAIRSRHPALPIVLLSQHIEIRHATELVSGPAFGYILKDRVLQVDEFLDALQRVAAGGSALDPAVVAALVAHHRRSGLGTLQSLTGREPRCSPWRPKASPTPPWPAGWWSPSEPSRPTCARSSRSSRSPTPTTTIAASAPSSPT